MSALNVSKIIKSVQITVSKHSPEILTGIGIAGMITSTVLAVKATPKALELLKEAEKKNIDKQLKEGIPGPDIKNGLPAVEVVKTAWKPYVPSAITGAVSIACLIGACSVSSRRTAALAAAYQLSETALSEYRDKVIETIGEKKEKTVREKIADDKLAKNSMNSSDVIITQKGNTLFMDSMSGQFFRSDIDMIKKAVNDLNEQLLNDPFGYISLNEFYDAIELEHSDIGEELGWNVSKGIIRIDFHAKLKNDEPCIVLDYVNPPVWDYMKFS